MDGVKWLGWPWAQGSISPLSQPEVPTVGCRKSRRFGAVPLCGDTDGDRQMAGLLCGSRPGMR